MTPSEKAKERYGLDLDREGKFPCPRCRRKGNDTAGDNLHCYGYGKGAYCHACNFTIPSDDHAESMGWTLEEDEDVEVTTKDPITDEQNAAIKKQTSWKGSGYRGIDDEINKKFGVRYEYNELGEPIKQLVPTTQNYKLVGYKVRRFPKDFTAPIGIVGAECDMVGEFLFKNATRTVVICAGEIKMLAAYQMFVEDLKARRKEDYEPPAVVCSSIGEGNAWKQIQKRYAFFNQFDKIVVCFDPDEAGEKGAEAAARVLPKGKVYMMKMSGGALKDPDDYLKHGKRNEFIQAFWQAKQYMPAGVLGSGDLSTRLREEAFLEKIRFPDFMEEVNDMTAGGIGLGRIVNIGAASGLGKTVYVDECVMYWAFNSPHLVGIVSMELNAGQYGISMLSRYIKYKINNIADPEEKRKFLEQDWVKAKERELFFRTDDTHRFYLVDDRDGSVDDLKAVVEQLVIQCDVKVIVLDPLQDILDGMTNDEQAVFLKWQKSLVKSHNVTFININHVRKSSGGGQQNSNGAMISEEDFQGSSTIFKSAALNILLVRDKMNPDPLIRNTTNAFISKNRDNSQTGPAGSFYYDMEQHKLYNLKAWLEANGPKDF
jgi:hypothetical protein